MFGKTRDKKIFWNAPHEGCGFEEDSKTVFQLLQTLLDECACSHVIATCKRSEDAVSTWQDLSVLCNGEGEETKRAITARTNLKNAKHHDERTKPFATLVAEVAGCHETLHLARSPISLCEQVNMFLDDILSNVTHVDVRAAMTNARSSHPKDFTHSCNVISTNLWSIWFHILGKKDCIIRRISFQSKLK